MPRNQASILRAGAATIITLTLLSACAQSAAPSPEVQRSVNAPRPPTPEVVVNDQALTCPEIAAEIIRLEGQNRRAEGLIKSNRPRRQIAGFLAALFLVSDTEVDTSEEQAALLNKNQQRQDDLRGLKRAKAC